MANSLRSKTVKTGLKLSRFLATPINADNLAQKRQALHRLEKFFPVPRGTRIVPVSSHGFNGEWITVPQSAKNRVILYMPGGGFVLRSHIHRDMIARLAAASKARVLSLHYSLAPEHPYPTALNEATAAYRWLLQQGIDASQTAFAGDSAGGALVLSTIHALKSNALPNPACAVVIAPATDATLSNPSVMTNQDRDFLIKLPALDFFIKSYFADTPTNDPIASPYHGSFKGFPPLLVHIDKDELMYSDSATLVKKARQQGAKVEFYESQGLWHVWHLFARYMPEAKRSIHDIGQFIQAHWVDNDSR